MSPISNLVMSNDDAMLFITDQLKAGVTLENIAGNMLDSCLEKGSKDNMSVVIVFFDAAPKPVPGHVAAYRPLQAQPQAQPQAAGQSW